MLEESVTSLPSIWASMNSWLTPTVLFVFLNLMIGTIAITSSFAAPKPHDQPNSDKEKHPHQPQPQHQYHHHPQLVRSPSVLQRLKSINFYAYRSHEPTALTFEKPHDFDSSYVQSYPQEPPPLQQEPPPLQQEPPPEKQQQPPLSRSPSTLQRLKSNLYTYLSPEPTTVNNVQNQGQKREKEEEIRDQEHEPEQTLDEIYSKLQGNNKVSRSSSDTKPVAGEVPTKLPKKMKKSASTKSAFAHFEEDDIVEKRRPATVRERKLKATEEEEAEVDARADDFINRFKQQLKLQRIDSIMRYKEMVSRGSEM